jgi:hypothetical protein
MLSGVQNEFYLTILRDIKNKQCLVFIAEVNIFDIRSIFLVKIISVSIPPNAGMKVANDFLMPEFAMSILPTAVRIQPKYGLVSVNDNFGGWIGHLFVNS